MTTIPTLRESLSLLKRKSDVSGPLALFLGKVLDRIEALEQPASAIRPGFFDQHAGDYLNHDAVPSTGSTIYRGAKT